MSRENIALVLAALVLTDKAEREAGFDGWCAPPSNQFNSELEILLNEGLIERKKVDKGDDLYRPTPEGIEACNITINRVQ